jgi:hypothetical protein
MSLEYILGKPKIVEGAGKIHPIKLKDWDEFEQCVSVLIISKKYFDNVQDEDYLLDLLLKLHDDNVLEALEKIFAMCFMTDNSSVQTNKQDYWFPTEESNSVNKWNFDFVRETIIRQNLIMEPKLYKDPLMQKWAEKALEARKKNAIDMTLEDKISVVAAFTGKHYWDLENYTMYQLDAEFSRLCKIKNFDVQTLALSNPNADPSKIKPEHYAEKIDLFKNPYDDLFKTKEKLNNINKAIKG